MATGGSSDDPKKDRKQRIIEELAVIEEDMREWGQQTPEQIETDLEEYNKDRADRDRIVGKAIRAGLSDHSFVQAWLAEKRSFGEWDGLRRFRAGLETDVERPISKEDFFVAYHAYGLTEKGRKPEGIRRELCRKLRIDKPEGFFGLTAEETKQLAKMLSAMPRQNFHRWLRKLNVID